MPPATNAEPIRVDNRVPYPKRHHRLGWGIALSATVLFSIAASAQSPAAPCGLDSVQMRTPLSYPPIARAAHVEGMVIAMVSFDRTGAVGAFRTLSGPAILTGTVEAAVRTWFVTDPTSYGECPLVVTFRSKGPVSEECTSDLIAPPSPSVTIIDPQHYVVTAQRNCVTITRDPASKLIHKRFPFF